jgi:quercetin dioxygenase-like cupin family protein
MFCPASDSGFARALPGIDRKTIAFGALTLMTELRMERGSTLPLHVHPHEQTGYLVRGRLRLTIAGEAFEVGPGGSWSVPGGAQHGAEILDDAVAIEVFSPVRQDYLP